MKNNKTLSEWVKEHKKEIIITTVGVTSVVSIALVVKNWNSIKGLFSTSKSAPITTVKANKQIVEKIIAQIIPEHILENLTGNRLTARELGSKALCSDRTINKRIVDAGLAIKLPCGEYSLTDTGRLVGELTWKTTRAGHSFTNIEWDEKILELLFSSEELNHIEERKLLIKEVLENNVA
jgi:hypothetical protein